jgi:hypothetical protein
MRKKMKNKGSAGERKNEKIINNKIILKNDI